MARQWREHWQWPTIGLLWVVTFILGYIGFSKLSLVTGVSRSHTDNLYLALQLFTLESGSAVGQKSWELEVARFMAPVVTAYTALAALASIFLAQWHSFRLYFIRDHFIICGLGRKGYRLAQGILADGGKVVVIERNEDDDEIEPCRSLGAIVLVGDGADPETLRRARIGRARVIFSVSGADNVNAEVAMRAREIVREAGLGGALRKPITCVVHIVNPRLSMLLRESEIEGENARGFRLEFFNVFDTGARAIWQRFPGFTDDPTRPSHPLVVGLGYLGESLVLQMAKNWRNFYTATGKRLQISVLDRLANQKVEALYIRYPQLNKVCELIPLEMEIHSPVFQRGEFLFARDNISAITIAYICLDDESLGLFTALTIRQHLPERHLPIIVRMQQETGLASLISQDAGAGSLKDLHVFGLMETYSSESLLMGSHELLARAIFQGNALDYAKLLRITPLASEQPSWETIDGQQREFFYWQADQVGEVLTSVGCQSTLQLDWEAMMFQFTAQEIGAMARFEHALWANELNRRGWKVGELDWKKKRHPYLVSWENLPLEIQSMDEELVSRIPEMLEVLRLQIRRTEKGD